MSTKVVVGNIPDKICYIYSLSQEAPVGCIWDIDYGPKSQTIKETVFPTFPADNGDSKMLNTGISWAKSIWRYQNITSEDMPEPTKDVVDNIPISNIKILSVESRGNNGRAYKALINKYYVDLREDVVMDTMLQVGVENGGILKGEFIWAKCGSQMKLVRVGSELHKIIVEYDSKKNIKAVRKNALEVGTIYQTKKKQQALFLGCIDTIQLNNDYRQKNTPYYGSYNYNHPAKNDDDQYLAFTELKIKKQMLFLKMYNHQTMEKNLEPLNAVKNEKYSTYYFEMKNAHVYIEKVESVQLDPNVLEIIRSNVLYKIKMDVLKYIDYKKGTSQTIFNASSLSYYIKDYSKFINMSLHKTEPKEVFDLQKYLIFS